MIKIKVGIASLVEREEQLIKTIDSLINQVDEIHVCLNNYLEPPYEHEKVTFFYSDNVFGDYGKFLGLKGFDGYYFTADDDIIYPPTYIQDTIPHIDMYGVVSYHGRTFTKYPIMSYHRTPAIRNRCLQEYLYTEPVDIAGTGVMGMRTDIFKPPFDIFKERNMADIFVSCYAKEQGIRIWGLKHSADYFTYQHVPNTIYDSRVDNCEYETRLVNKHFNK